MDEAKKKYIVVLGDLHASPKIKDTIKLLKEEIIENLRSMRGKIEFIICLGDMVNSINNAGACDSIQMAESFFVGILEQCDDNVTMFLIIGNHDRPNNTTINPSDHLFHIKNVEYRNRINIISSPSLYCPTINGKGRSIAIIPYHPNDKFPSLPSVDLCFAHQEFKGSKLSKYIKSRNGSDVPNVPIVSGHLHDHHYYDSVLYAGSLHQVNFDERYDKYMWLLTFEDDDSSKKWQNVGTKYKCGSVVLEQIVLDSMPKKVTLNMDDVYEILKENISILNNKNLYKIILNKHISSYDSKFMETLNNLSNVQIVICANPKNIEDITGSNGDETLNSFDEYLRRNKELTESLNELEKYIL